MATGFLAKNWKPIALVAGVALARELLQRRNIIDLNERVVLITGGSRGLGLAMAEEFALQGARLVLCAREEDELERARMRLSEFGIEVLTVPGDVSNEADAQRIVSQATERFGRVDILVNNAGIISVGPIETLTRSDFEESMNITFWGAYNMTMAVLPQMKERRDGRVVNITSIGGKVSVPHLLPYCSAKFALVGFSEGLHSELARYGILVTTVAPGLMRTGSPPNAFMKGEGHRTEYTLFTLLDTLPVSSISAQRAARQIVNATKRGETELIISVQAQVAARLYGAFPGLVSNLLSLTNRLLPSGEGQGTARYQGKESETPVTKSPLTTLGQRASQEYNEQDETEKS